MGDAGELNCQTNYSRGFGNRQSGDPDIQKAVGDGHMVLWAMVNE